MSGRSTSPFPMRISASPRSLRGPTGWKSRKKQSVSFREKNYRGSVGGTLSPPMCDGERGRLTVARRSTGGMLCALSDGRWRASRPCALRRGLIRRGFADAACGIAGRKKEPNSGSFFVQRYSAVKLSPALTRFSPARSWSTGPRGARVRQWAGACRTRRVNRSRRWPSSPYRACTAP